MKVKEKLTIIRFLDEINKKSQEMKKKLVQTNICIFQICQNFHGFFFCFVGKIVF